MPIDLYLMEASAPCRAVLMTAKQLGIDLNKKPIDLTKQEQLKPEFIKMNPQHTVPTLDDNGYYVWESRAILTYLANKYAPDNNIYPKDPQKRGVVDRLLYFDLGVLYKTLADYSKPFLFMGKEKDPEKEKAFENSLKFLDGFLEKSTYVAGDHLTLADLSILATITITEVFDYDLSAHPHLHAWYTKLKSQLPYFKEVNEPGLRQLKEYIEMRKQEHKKINS
ncbi:glutathione S-transferase 1-like [Centruroides sculpturatus]|uniref:glutathione S-transferase 1-like n=1 Tax=Centruroides sculpturatus TaxID=218467 RepID=UPI000C6DDB69|nr:glutathione S-transferase 1-like [Centruroides sculpturatus]